MTSRRIPSDYEPMAAAGARAFALPHAAAWTRRILAQGRSLHAAAAEADRRETRRGRGTVHVIPADAESEPDASDRPQRWAVRHYLRGGAVARILEDRYLRVGTPRPVREARASAEARKRGVRTPRVVAGAIYPAGVFYRADLVTEFVEASRELAALLFEGSIDEDRGLHRAALRESGHLIRAMAAAGVEHADLNARNILLGQEDGELHAWLLDLDRCRVARAQRSVSPRRMLRRLSRSLRKLESASGRPLDPDDLEVLSGAALGSGGPA